MSRILIVDDETRIVEFVTRGLSARGYDVDGVRTADEARLLVGDTSRPPYDLVILDLLMPGTPGAEFLQELGVTHPDTPVLVLSAVADLRARVRMLDLGAADYLGKPFALEELLARVRVRLRDIRRRSTGDVLAYAGLRLDTDQRTVTHAAGTHELPGREFLLLRELLEARGRVCSKKALLSAVWGYDHDPGSNVVEVYIKRLRDKIGVDTIRTVRNVGYCLVA